MPDVDAPLLPHDLRPGDRRTHELLQDIVARLANVELGLADLRGSIDLWINVTDRNQCSPRIPRSREFTDTAIAPLIAACCGSRAFNAAELVDHCRLATATALRAALTAACGGTLDPRRVGLALRRLQNVEGAGHVIRRIGEDRDGAVWQCGSAGVTPVDSHHDDRYRWPD